jgi:hypothetical protein
LAILILCPILYSEATNVNFIILLGTGIMTTQTKWVTQEEAEGNIGIYPESSNDCISVVWGCESNADAHAALIASAPELLTALKAARTGLVLIQNNVRDSVKIDPNWDGMVEMIDTYIARSDKAIVTAEKN